MKRKLLYVAAVIWVALFVWQTYAHATVPLPQDITGTWCGVEDGYLDHNHPCGDRASILITKEGFTDTEIHVYCTFSKILYMVRENLRHRPISYVIPILTLNDLRLPSRGVRRT